MDGERARGLLGGCVRFWSLSFCLFVKVVRGRDWVIMGQLVFPSVVVGCWEDVGFAHQSL